MSLQELTERTGIEPDIPLRDGPSQPPAPAAEVERGELHQRVGEALGAISPEGRAVVVLKDVEGCDYEQISAILRIPIGTVKSRLHRARLELKDRLEKYL